MSASGYVLEFILACLIGVFFGTFTGLVPGIHANTVVFVSLPIYLNSEISLMIYMSFVSGLSVSHTFHDFLPAIFLGLAEAESCLATLPGPAMASRGKGLTAFSYTVSGGLTAALIFLVSLPLLFLFLKPLYSKVSGLMLPLLLFFSFYIVLKTENLVLSFLIAASSSMLGVLSFDSVVNQTYVLMPVFGGLFSAPSIIRGLSHEVVVPPQDEELESEKSTVSSFVGFIAGLIAGLIPGLGSATLTSFLTPLLGSRKNFLTAMGAVNTSDILVSFIALIIIGKSRSGASVAISFLTEFTAPQAIFLIGISVLATSISAPVSLRTSEKFILLLDYFKVSYMYLLAGITLFLTTLWLTGILGLLILFTASCIGFAATAENERKSCMMVLIFPAIQFYATSLTFYPFF